MWWMVGGITYGAGTLAESITTLAGWSEPVFRAWYITGAFLGGVPLAQGTVYLLMKRQTGHVLSAVLLAVLMVGSVFVIFSPVDYSLVETYRLSGAVLAWKKVRLISPLINIYAFLFLVGGAAVSAWKYRKTGGKGSKRYQGNVLIALGALLPGVGGASARAGFVEVLYLTELIGLMLIWLGYRIIRNADATSIHANQVTA